jgi:hypothetical protein
LTKGKLYEEIYQLDQESPEGYAEPLQKILDEAKKEFLETSKDTHSMEDHYDNIFIWFKKWFGNE